MLAKTIPGDWIIVLKEHPTGLKLNCREVDFYKKIQKLPNVVFAPLNAETEKLIQLIVENNHLNTLKDMGALMKELKANHSGVVDMALAGRIAKSKLTN